MLNCFLTILFPIFTITTADVYLEYNFFACKCFECYREYEAVQLENGTYRADVVLDSVIYNLEPEPIPLDKLEDLKHYGTLEKFYKLGFDNEAKRFKEKFTIVLISSGPHLTALEKSYIMAEIEDSEAKKNAIINETKKFFDNNDTNNLIDLITQSQSTVKLFPIDKKNKDNDNYVTVTCNKYCTSEILKFDVKAQRFGNHLDYGILTTNGTIANEQLLDSLPVYIPVPLLIDMNILSKNINSINNLPKSISNLIEDLDRNYQAYKVRMKLMWGKLYFLPKQFEAKLKMVTPHIDSYVGELVHHDSLKSMIENIQNFGKALFWENIADVFVNKELTEHPHDIYKNEYKEVFIELDRLIGSTCKQGDKNINNNDNDTIIQNESSIDEDTNQINVLKKRIQYIQSLREELEKNTVTKAQ